MGAQSRLASPLVGLLIVVVVVDLLIRVEGDAALGSILDGQAPR